MYVCVYACMCVYVCVLVRVCLLMLNVPIIFCSHTIQYIGCYFLSTMSLLDCTDDHHKGLGDSYCCLYFIMLPYCSILSQPEENINFSIAMAILLQLVISRKSTKWDSVAFKLM